MELQDVVDEVSRTLGEPVVLEDRDFTLVAYGSHPDELDPVRQRTILQRRSTAAVQAWFERFGIATSEKPVRTPDDAEFGVVARVCLPARWNGVTYGYLWVLDARHRISDAELERVMRHAARAGTIMAGQARTREHLAEQARDLLVADPDTAEAAAAEIDRLGAIGRDRPIRAIAVRSGSEGAAAPLAGRAAVSGSGVEADEVGSAPLVNPWRLPRGAVVADVADHALLLAPAAAAEEVAAAARRLLAERAEDVVVGIGGERADLVGLRDSAREARIALRVARAVPRLRPTAHWDALGAYRLLACGPRPALRAGAVDAAVLPLLAHPVLTETATVYLDLAGNAARTAAALRIHRQTLYHRLGRIAELTGLDLADGQDRLTLHLALTLAPVVR
jgi:hypothetical protein